MALLRPEKRPGLGMSISSGSKNRRPGVSPRVLNSIHQLRHDLSVQIHGRQQTSGPTFEDISR